MAGEGQSLWDSYLGLERATVHVNVLQSVKKNCWPDHWPGKHRRYVRSDIHPDAFRIPAGVTPRMLFPTQFPATRKILIITDLGRHGEGLGRAMCRSDLRAPRR